VAVDGGTVEGDGRSRNAISGNVVLVRKSLYVEVLRAKVVLLGAAGPRNDEIAAELSVYSEKWTIRFSF
jgi:hypothetical protein